MRILLLMLCNRTGETWLEPGQVLMVSEAVRACEHGRSGRNVSSQVAYVKCL